MEVNITLSVSPESSPRIESQATSLTIDAPNPSDQNLPQPISLMQLTLQTGETIIVTGPNGVGKSALLAEIARGLFEKRIHVETFFGSRHIHFQSDEVDQVGQNLDQLQAQLNQSVTRFRNPWGEQHLKSVVRRVTNLQAQSAFDIIAAQQSGSKFDKAICDNPQVVATINGVFAAARLPIQIILAGGILRAQRGTAQFGIERLSDGERAALLIVGAVLIQPLDSFIIVDEPERHLNPAISGALLAALIRTRRDLGFIFATHDLELIEWLKVDQIIHLRDSFVIKTDPEERRFDLTLLSGEEDVPEELRFAILGSRRLLLLVEGAATSEDKALYGHIYPGWNVVARGGWETVSTGVRALGRNQHYHWLQSAGIIDRDGRDAQECESLAADQIFCLPVPTIENLFLHATVLEQMAAGIHELKGGPTAAGRLDALTQELQRVLPTLRDEIIARRLVWEGNRLLSERKLSVKAVRAGQIEIAAIDLAPIRQRLEAEFASAIADDNTIEMLTKIPVKNSQVPEKVATALGFDSFRDFVNAVLHQIEIESVFGKAILASLKDTMPKILIRS